MNTITLWLLVSLGDSGSTGMLQPTHVVERFITQAECERVQKVIDSTPRYRWAPLLRCIQATVYAGAAR